MLGLQQSSEVSDPATIGLIVVGIALLAGFVLYELRTEHPLIRMRIFSVTAASRSTTRCSMADMFVPLFFFEPAQPVIGLEQSGIRGRLYLLIFFGGFASPRRSADASSTSAARAARRCPAPSSPQLDSRLAQQLPDLDLEQRGAGS